MEKIELKVVGLSYSQTQTGAYALILGEANGRRRLPIIIGGSEAQAIAIPLEKMTPSRPLTHDLFKNFIDTFAIAIEEVIIYNLVEGIFFAKLICDHNGTKHEIDARSSDAVALALRSKCPIYTHDFILGSAGIILDEDSDTDEESAEEFDLEELAKETGGDEQVSLGDLEQQLKTALEKEEYEKASRLRDEIKRRKNN